ncbi:serine/threonine-protein phosphatase, partial [[Kitasatospora] papulosa]
MDGRDLELGELLTAAESAPPGESVGVIAHDLRKRFGAYRVSFLFADLMEQRLLRLTAPADGDLEDAEEPIDLQGTVYDAVLRDQRQHVDADGEGGRRVISPVSNRG